MIEIMDKFQQNNPELAERIVDIFVLDNLCEFSGEIQFLKIEELINHETICGVVGEKINQEAVDYLFDIEVDEVLILFFDGKIGSMFVPMTCCEASVFEYINNKCGSSLQIDFCDKKDEKQWVYFESE